MTRSFGGRARQAQLVTRERPPRAPAAVFASVCLSESFDGGSWPIGSDLTWVEGHRAVGTASGSSFTVGTVSSDGSNSLQRTLHVVGGSLTIAAPDDSQLPGGAATWRTATGLARETSDLASSAMSVSATVTGVSSAVSPEYLLLACTQADVDEDLPNQNYVGYLARFGVANYIDLNMGYRSSVSGQLEGGGIFLDEASGTPTLVEGDVLTLTVTGDPTDPTVTCAINGTTYLTVPSSTIIPAMLLGEPATDLPAGTQAGAGLLALRTGTDWNHGTMDDVISMDNWEVCPA